MPDINISVRDKIAAQTGRAMMVCDNSDYTLVFDFDEEWAAYGTKTARFRWNGSYADVVFDGDTCPCPAIRDTALVRVGVFAGDLHTSTPAIVACLPSIRGGDGAPLDPEDDVYDQIMEKLNAMGEVSPEEIAAAVEDYLAENPVDAPVQSVNGQTGAVELTASDVGAAPETLVVNCYDNNGGYFVDCTFTDIVTVVKAGAEVVCDFWPNGERLLPLTFQWDNTVIFEGSTIFDNGIPHVFGVRISSDDTVEVYRYATTTLPNPQKLTLTGAVEAEYDGSSAVTVEIPAGGSDDTSLGITGATVGQTVKITAVDEDGRPTGWEAVDAEEEYELIHQGATGETGISPYEIDTDMNGNPFSLSKFRLVYSSYNPDDVPIMGAGINFNGLYKSSFTTNGRVTEGDSYIGLVGTATGLDNTKGMRTLGIYEGEVINGYLILKWLVTGNGYDEDGNILALSGQTGNALAGSWNTSISKGQLFPDGLQSVGLHYFYNSIKNLNVTLTGIRV